jgi:hypothetical protein
MATISVTFTIPSRGVKPLPQRDYFGVANMYKSHKTAPNSTQVA